MKKTNYLFTLIALLTMSTSSSAQVSTEKLEVTADLIFAELTDKKGAGSAVLVVKSVKSY